MSRLAFVFAVVAACKSDKPAPEAKPAQPGEPATAEPAAAAPVAPPSTPAGTGGAVAFELAGAAVSTAPKDKDTDPQTGNFNRANAQLSLFFYGGPAAGPRRGFLDIQVPAFSKQPGEHPKTRARYTWYATMGEGPLYAGPIAVAITKVDQVDADHFKVSGTFSGELPLALGMTSETKTAKLANGTFDDIVVTEIGKKP